MVDLGIEEAADLEIEVVADLVIEVAAEGEVVAEVHLVDEDRPVVLVGVVREVEEEECVEEDKLLLNRIVLKVCYKTHKCFLNFNLKY